MSQKWPMEGMRNIYTYCMPILDNQEWILDRWRETWASHGWKPVLLDQFDAGRHPAFESYTEIMEKKPLMNFFEYEMACFHRWLALAAVGGGVMSDYDCMNNGLTPDDISYSDELTIYEPPHVPSLVGGSAEEYERIAKLFGAFNVKDYKKELYPHTKGGTAVSDMLILANCPDQVKPCKIVAEYKSEGWQQAKAIHFSHNSCEEKKEKAIKEWLRG